MGGHLFLEKGCAGCHVVEGVKAQEDFGPDLSSVGAKGATQLDFGASKIPRDLISYLHSKITDPLSVNASARMPQYHLTPADLDAVTTALMAMTGTPATTALEKLTVSSQLAEFRPAGEFGSLNTRYQCDACHKFNGYGGTLAPDLSYEGSRANRDWLISFLRNPQTLRPTLILRMPQFNMSDRDTTVIADYIGLVLQAPEVNVAAVDRGKFTAEMAAAGKRLFDEKYQCQSCHTIGASGGYVGPSLTSVGNWMTAAWIEAWLRNPQKLVPGTTEPSRAFSEEEVRDLTAYLLSLRQSTSAAKEARASGARGRR
jgi:nitric oxide reductase subunit C